MGLNLPKILKKATKSKSVNSLLTYIAQPMYYLHSNLKKETKMATNIQSANVNPLLAHRKEEPPLVVINSSNGGGYGKAISYFASMAAVAIAVSAVAIGALTAAAFAIVGWKVGLITVSTIVAAPIVGTALYDKLTGR